MNPKNQKFLVTLDREVAQVLEAIADETGGTVPGFVRTWMAESLPALRQIMIAIQTAKAGNVAGAATRFAADMGRMQAENQMQLAELLDHAAQAQEAQTSKVVAETAKAPKRSAKKKPPTSAN